MDITGALLVDLFHLNDAEKCLFLQNISLVFFSNDVRTCSSFGEIDLLFVGRSATRKNG